jgi:hypothetical protein
MALFYFMYLAVKIMLWLENLMKLIMELCGTIFIFLEYFEKTSRNCSSGK